MIPPDDLGDVQRLDSYRDTARQGGSMVDSGNAAQDAFQATEAARFAFLGAVRSMTHGSHPVDVDYLIRLADRLFEAHDQSVRQTRLAAESPTAGD
jgi:hypothetical protein